MHHIATIFAAVCMVLSAASNGAVLFPGFQRVEPKELAERSLRFLKVPEKLLFNKIGAEQSDIHPAYLEDLLARSGIDLIAERIENENTVVDLLHFDARSGQGFLFSPSRPVCDEAPQNTSAVAEAIKLAGDSLNKTIVAGAAFG
jgi:hypothetical protein